ncbi:MAG: LTA synthase family protein [Halanaerobiaceae bacterium]
MSNLYNFTREQKKFATVFLLGILIKYNYILLRIFHVPSVTGVIFRNIILILFVVIFLFPLVKKRGGRTTLFILFLLFTFLFLFNFWYSRHFGDYMSYTDMTMGEEIDGFNPLKVFFLQMVKIPDIIFLIDVCLLGFFLRRARGRKFNWNQKQGTKKLKLVGGIIIILLIVIQIVVVGGLLGERNPGELYTQDTPGFVNTYGFFPLYGYEIYHVVFSGNSGADPGISTVNSELDLDGQSHVPEDTNIIVIQVESLDEKLIDYEHRGEEVTPFLNKLKRESRYYSRAYAQHANGSFDAEFSFLTSLYPANKNYVFREYDMSKFTSIINILNKKGYNTMAFHGNDRTFFHRHRAYPEFGFDRFYSKEDFDSETELPLGVNDREFFSASLDYLEEEEEPFFSYFITVTSHTPFNFYPEEKYRDKFKEIESRFVRDYFRSINYTDTALEMFFNGLEERGLMDDSVVIVYGDHGAGIDRKEFSSRGEFVMERDVKEPENIPLFIKYPGIEPEIDDRPGTPVDLAPTILDLLGETQKPEEFVGHSLLQEKEEPVIFLHEQPQVFYDDRLFIKNLDGFEQVGYRKNGEREKIELPREEETKVERIIEECRAIFFETEE